MRTAVDTNVFFDVFLPDPRFGPHSKKALEMQFSQGSLVIGEMVYSELSGFFPSQKSLDETLHLLGVQFVSSGQKVCYQAGETWKKYRKEGGSRQRVIADFMIAAHAEIHADALLTRDRGFYRKCFPHLTLIEP